MTEQYVPQLTCSTRPNTSCIEVVPASEVAGGGWKSMMWWFKQGSSFPVEEGVRFFGASRYPRRGQGTNATRWGSGRSPDQGCFKGNLVA